MFFKTSLEREMNEISANFRNVSYKATENTSFVFIIKEPKKNILLKV